MEAAEKRYRTMSQLLHESNLESLYRWIVAHMKRRKLKSCVQQSMDDLMSSFIPSSSRSSKSGPHHKNDTFNVKLKVGGGTSIK
eukprot:758484-Hanusia_phi.AAC.10